MLLRELELGAALGVDLEQRLAALDDVADGAAGSARPPRDGPEPRRASRFRSLPSSRSRGCARPAGEETTQRKGAGAGSGRAPWAATIALELLARATRVEGLLGDAVAAVAARPRRPARAAAPPGRATSRAGPPARRARDAARRARRAPRAAARPRSRSAPWASVTTTSTLELDRRGDAPEARRELLGGRRACAPWRVGPTGMSISAWVAPAVFFLERIDAIICASVSIPIGRSTVISTSSAGARSSAPPQRCSRPRGATTSRMRSGESATSASTPIVSAVPAGLVMARDEVFGTVTPERREDRHHDHGGAIAGDRRRCSACPRRPGRRSRRRDPQAIMASVSAMSSSSSRLGSAHASTNIASSVFE